MNAFDLPFHIRKMNNHFSAIIDTPLVLNIRENRDILEVFCEETKEHLKKIECALTELKQDPSVQQSKIEVLHRSYHTIKGGAGFLNFASTQALTQVIEFLLDDIRNFKRELNPYIIQWIQESHQILKSQLKQVEIGLNENREPQEVIEVFPLLKIIQSHL